MTNKQRKSFQELPIANISLKQFDAETKNFAPDEEKKVAEAPLVNPEPAAIVTPVVSAPVAAAPIARVIETSAPSAAAVSSVPEKETKRLTIDLDDQMNYKFSQYALDQGKKKTEIIREWISAAIAGR